MSDTATPEPLIGARLAELLALLGDVDSVELKMTVPDAARRSAVEALGMDPLEGQIRQVWFFDTPGLALQDAGVVVRARRVQGRGDDSVVKLRPVVPKNLPDELRASPGFIVEVDVLPGGTSARGRCARATRGRASRSSSPADPPCTPCSPRSSAPSTPPTRPRASRWTTSPPWGR